eukprot:TRINITY_DN536_c0_g1_i14.p1 TRINITY_DN536_c0_g1~~TRINITY_DN536_c0_g1_i14.p1  ORF type:complete len:796 (+),score=132.44 TRINITY_DN536_c0_g1_i14:92-2479(+)
MNWYLIYDREIAKQIQQRAEKWDLLGIVKKIQQFLENQQREKKATAPNWEANLEIFDNLKIKTLQNMIIILLQKTQNFLQNQIVINDFPKLIYFFYDCIEFVNLEKEYIADHWENISYNQQFLIYRMMASFARIDEFLLLLSQKILENNKILFQEPLHMSSQSNDWAPQQTQSQVLQQQQAQEQYHNLQNSFDQYLHLILKQMYKSLQVITSEWTVYEDICYFVMKIYLDFIEKDEKFIQVQFLFKQTYTQSKIFGIVENMLNYSKISFKNIQDSKTEKFYKIDTSSKVMSPQPYGYGNDLVEIKQGDYDRMSKELENLMGATDQQSSSSYQIKFGNNTFEGQKRFQESEYWMGSKNYSQVTAIKSPRQSLQQIWSDPNGEKVEPKKNALNIGQMMENFKQSMPQVVQPEKQIYNIQIGQRDIFSFDNQGNKIQVKSPQQQQQQQSQQPQGGDKHKSSEQKSDIAQSELELSQLQMSQSFDDSEEQNQKQVYSNYKFRRDVVNDVCQQIQKDEFTNFWEYTVKKLVRYRQEVLEDQKKENQLVQVLFGQKSQKKTKYIAKIDTNLLRESDNLQIQNQNSPSPLNKSNISIEDYEEIVKIIEKKPKKQIFYKKKNLKSDVLPQTRRIYTNAELIQLVPQMPQVFQQSYLDGMHKFSQTKSQYFQLNQKIQPHILQKFLEGSKIDTNINQHLSITNENKIKRSGSADFSEKKWYSIIHPKNFLDQDAYKINKKKILSLSKIRQLEQQRLFKQSQSNLNKKDDLICQFSISLNSYLKIIIQLFFLSVFHFFFFHFFQI